MLEVSPYSDGGDGLGRGEGDFTDTVIDNAFAKGGYMAGRYLVERGHRISALFPARWAQHRRGPAGGAL